MGDGRNLIPQTSSDFLRISVTPTNVRARDPLSNEDYGEKSCIPIQHIKRVSKHFQWSENREDIAVIEIPVIPLK